MPATAKAVQRLQLGQESSYNAGGSAGKSLQSFSFMPTPKTNSTIYGAMGRRASQGAAPEKQWTEFTLDAPIALYGESLYLYEAAFGAVSPTTPGGGTITRKRVYSPALTGYISTKSIVAQWGDPGNVNIMTGGTLTGFNKKWSRDAIALTSTGFGSVHSTGGAFTVNPTVMANQPQLGKHLNYYLDSTGAGLGTTQLKLTVLSAECDIKNLRAPYFDSDRANTSVADTVDGALGLEFKMALQEQATTRAIINGMYGITQFIRVEEVGPIIEGALTYIDTWDLAVQLRGDAPFGADGDVWKRDLTFEIVEDATWGHYMQITNQSAEASL